MKFQIISNQNGNKQEEVPKEQERISGARSENATVTEQKELSCSQSREWDIIC